MFNSENLFYYDEMIDAETNIFLQAGTNPISDSKKLVLEASFSCHQLSVMKASLDLEWIIF